MVKLPSHPLLAARCFTTEFPLPLSALPSPDWLRQLLQLAAAAPLASDDPTRASVRDLLRHGGYKPTGRSKPASEYLLRAVGEGALGSINAAVDSCNVVSLHSGLPVSVVDLDLAAPPFHIAIAGPGESYVFNPAGQVIDIAGLICLYDAAGPCANPVKDAQRTKTSPATRRTLTVIWGAQALLGRLTIALDWYRQLLAQLGAQTELLP